MPLILSGSIDLTGSITATKGFTGSLHGTASYALEGPLGSVRTTGSTIYSYYPPTTGVNTTESIFLGLDAGYNATAANNSVFLSTGAGYAATNADNSNFIGFEAGKNATNANQANFIGYQAGEDATNAQYSNFIGLNAGIGARNSYNSNFIGTNAGNLVTDADLSNFIGAAAGFEAYSASRSNFIGSNTGAGAINAEFSNFLGESAGVGAMSASNSNFIGSGAGFGAVSGSYSNIIGYQAGYSASKATFSNFIGTSAGGYAINASYSTFIGYNAGYEATQGPRSVGINNIIIGTNITLPSGSRNSINIGGVIFATGSYGTTTGNPFSGSVQSARVGIGTRTPLYTLHVSGTVGFSNLTDSNTANRVVLMDSNGRLFTTSSTTVGSSGPISVIGTTLYSNNPAAGPGFSTSHSVVLGTESGYNASNAQYTTFIGYRAGYTASNATYLAGIGYQAGEGATNAQSSNFLGYNAGYQATSASGSNFLGAGAGAYAKYAGFSNIMGFSAGVNAESASFSTLIGYCAGYDSTGYSSIGSNNIIIGTNITLPVGAKDSINIGGILFGTGSYSDINAVNPSSSPAYGKIGVNVVAPAYTFDVEGDGNFRNNLTVTSSLSVTGSATITGSLTIVIGSSSVMGTKQYEPLTVERSGDLKMGVYTTVTDFASGGAALALGYSSVTASSTYYPGFEMQMVGSVTQSQNRLRFNSLERNSAGLVFGSYNDILTVYDDGRVVLNASLSGTKTGGNGSQLIVGATSSAYTFDVTGSARLTGPLLTSDIANTNNNFTGSLATFQSNTANNVRILYTSASKPAVGGPTFILASPNFQIPLIDANNNPTVNSYGPGFEIQEWLENTETDTRLRINYVRIESDGSYLQDSGHEDLISIFPSGRIRINPTGSRPWGGGGGLYEAGLSIGTNLSQSVLEVSGSVRFSNCPVSITGSLTISDVLVLPPVDPLPASRPTGSFAVSGSGVNCRPYFWNGATWTALF